MAFVHGRVAVNESFGPWPLWLRTAASSPYIDVLPLTLDVAIESEQLGESFRSTLQIALSWPLRAYTT